MRAEHVKYRAEQQLVQSTAISKAYDNLISGEITQQRVDIRLQAVKEQWEEFNTTHRALSLAVSKLNPNDQQEVRRLSYFSEDVFTATRECFLETIAKMHDRYRNRQPYPLFVMRLDFLESIYQSLMAHCRTGYHSEIYLRH